MTREVWQAYDCPNSLIDIDLFDAEMVYQGQAIQCHGCGGAHLAGIDVRVETFVQVGDAMEFPELPADADGLQRLKTGSWAN